MNVDRTHAGRLYGFASVVTFLVMAGQLIGYYFGNAQSISLFADTFHAGSDGVVLLGTTALLVRTVSLFGTEARTHRVFTFVNIALLFLGVFLATHELLIRLDSPVPPSWSVLVVATLGGIGDWYVKKLLRKVDVEDLPTTLRTNHQANLLHITQDLWTSWVVVLSGIAIAIGFPTLDLILGGIVTFVIFWEGVGLLYEEVSGKHFPFHLHSHGHQHNESHDEHACHHCDESEHYRREHVRHRDD